MSSEADSHDPDTYQYPATFFAILTMCACVASIETPDSVPPRPEHPELPSHLPCCRWEFCH